MIYIYWNRENIPFQEWEQLIFSLAYLKNNAVVFDYFSKIYLCDFLSSLVVCKIN